MDEAYRIGNDNIEKSASYNKSYYDKRLHGVEIKVGDHVLELNPGEGGDSGKLRSHWKPVIYEVVNKQKDFPVFDIRDVEGKGKLRTVHRNRLKLCNELAEDAFVEDGLGMENKELKAPAKSKRGRKKRGSSMKQQRDVVQEDEDENFELEAIIHEELPPNSESLQENDAEGDVVGEDDLVENADDPVAVLEETVVEPETAEVEDADVADDTIPYDEDSESDSDAEPRSTRSSSRVPKPRRILTYNELGDPVWT